jgi:uncharacterized OsmC-like protein
MSQTFAGKPFESMLELAQLALANPVAAKETFTVTGEYGNVPHGHLGIERTGGFGTIDEVGPLAYEDLIIGAVRCVGTDYLDYMAANGVEVDAVQLEVEATWDVRGMGIGLGLKVPPGLTAGWQGITVRARVRTDAPKDKVERANRIAWQTNVAAASLASVPTRFEVTVEPLAQMAAR